MTKDDTSAEDDGPITPEVVRGRGAAARKRRAPGEAGDADLGDAEAPAPAGRLRASTGTLFRIGCMLLIAIGVMELFLSSQLVLDPDQARCTAARFQINDAIDDDETFNDVALPDDLDDADDLPCDEAVALAGTIPDDEDEEPDGEFVSASAFRTQGLIIGTLGLGHAVTGFLTLRTRARAARTAALAFIAIGILLPALGLISLLVLVFAVYALVFSADAKAIFGSGSRLFRPRVPPAS